jgi:hypothetical protein
MSNISAESSHLSVWKSPVPYLLIGVGAMLLLIGCVVIILACSYFNKSSGDSEQQESNGTNPHNVEHAYGGKNETTDDMSHLSDDNNWTPESDRNYGGDETCGKEMAWRLRLVV